MKDDINNFVNGDGDSFNDDNNKIKIIGSKKVIDDQSKKKSLNNFDKKSSKSTSIPLKTQASETSPNDINLKTKPQVSAFMIPPD